MGVGGEVGERGSSSFSFLFFFFFFFFFFDIGRLAFSRFVLRFVLGSTSKF